MDFHLQSLNFKKQIINSKINLICHLIAGPLVKIDSIINPEITKKEWNLYINFQTLEMEIYLN